MAIFSAIALNNPVLYTVAQFPFARMNSNSDNSFCVKSSIQWKPCFCVRVRLSIQQLHLSIRIKDSFCLVMMMKQLQVLLKRIFQLALVNCFHFYCPYLLLKVRAYAKYMNLSRLAIKNQRDSYFKAVK